MYDTLYAYNVGEIAAPVHTLKIDHTVDELRVQVSRSVGPWRLPFVVYVQHGYRRT